MHASLGPECDRLMRREDLVALIAHALERSAARPPVEDAGSPWSEDLRPRDIVRLLQERAREVAMRVYSEEDDER